MFLEFHDRCVLPFGVLVAATPVVNDTNLLHVAKIVAEFIDQDLDGKFDST